MSDDLICETCQKEPAVGVASVPGIPYSAAYGKECLEANAHPYWLIVANTSMCFDPTIDSETLQGMADWWTQMVEDTLAHLGISREKFDQDVRKEAIEFARLEAEPKEAQHE